MQSTAARWRCACSEITLNTQILQSIEPAKVTVAIVKASGAELRPQFETRFYRWRVREDTFPGIEVGTVKAKVNGNPQANIKYGIYSGDPHHHFIIDPMTGVITVAKDLDADGRNAQSLMLNVQAVHAAQYAHTQVNVRPCSSSFAFALFQVEIYIDDVNDNSPIFDTKKVRASVSESHLISTNVSLRKCFFLRF